MVVFKLRDSVSSVRYSTICNVLRLWRTSLIPTYRVYRLYDYVYTVLLNKLEDYVFATLHSHWWFNYPGPLLDVESESTCLSGQVRPIAFV